MDIGYFLDGSPLRQLCPSLQSLKSSTRSLYKKQQQIIRNISYRNDYPWQFTRVFISKHLLNCSHVFVFNSAATSSWEPVYIGCYVFQHQAPEYFNWNSWNGKKIKLQLIGCNHVLPRNLKWIAQFRIKKVYIQWDNSQHPRNF